MLLIMVETLWVHGMWLEATKLDVASASTTAMPIASGTAATCESAFGSGSWVRAYPAHGLSALSPTQPDLLSFGAGRFSPGTFISQARRLWFHRNPIGQDIELPKSSLGFAGLTQRTRRLGRLSPPTRVQGRARACDRIRNFVGRFIRLPAPSVAAKCPPRISNPGSRGCRSFTVIQRDVGCKTSPHFAHN